MPSNLCVSPLTRPFSHAYPIRQNTHGVGRGESFHWRTHSGFSRCPGWHFSPWYNGETENYMHLCLIVFGLWNILFLNIVHSIIHSVSVYGIYSNHLHNTPSLLARHRGVKDRTMSEVFLLYFPSIRVEKWGVLSIPLLPPTHMCSDTHTHNQ